MNVDKVFRNQDQELGPGFSKEFYDELHRFYSKGNRRSGRTYLLARVLVNTAIETGDTVYLNDHYIFDRRSRNINMNLLAEIRKVIEIYSDKGLSLDYKQEERDGGCIKISLTGNIYRSTEKYIQIKNDYQPFSQPLTPEECFKPQNRKLLLIKI